MVGDEGKTDSMYAVPTMWSWGWVWFGGGDDGEGRGEDGQHVCCPYDVELGMGVVRRDG
ncbi:MAG: hypothetical protein JNJ78_02540 [Anaerolineae bacterium]|nr:hypothetical protein [Anaerolineae bacterium]